LTVVEVANLDRVHAEIVAALRQRLDGLLLGEIEHHLCAQHHEGHRARRRLVESLIEFLLNRRLQALCEATNLLVDDADVDVHAYSLPPAGTRGPSPSRALARSSSGVWRRASAFPCSVWASARWRLRHPP